jgi:hypothetical protein
VNLLTLGDVHTAWNQLKALKWPQHMRMANMRDLLSDAIRHAEFDCLRWDELLAWGLDGVDPSETSSCSLKKRICVLKFMEAQIEQQHQQLHEQLLAKDQQLQQQHEQTALTAGEGPSDRGVT